MLILKIYYFGSSTAKKNISIIKELAEQWQDKTRRPVDREFVGKVIQILKNDGIRQYNIVEFIDHWFDIMKEDANKFNEQQS